MRRLSDSVKLLLLCTRIATSECCSAVFRITFYPRWMAAVLPSVCGAYISCVSGDEHIIAAGSDISTRKNIISLCAQEKKR